MSAMEPGHDWEDSYIGPPPPWDIGHPQEAFVRLATAGALSSDVLDAGCGTGEHTILAAGHGARATGVDISTRAVEAARIKARDREVEASFQAMDALQLGDLGSLYDVIVDSGLFHTFDVELRDRYVSGLHSVLRPGGHVYLMCFSDRQPGEWGPHRVTEAELRSAFANGWRIESLAPDRFEINPGMGALQAEAWLLDTVRL